MTDDSLRALLIEDVDTDAFLITRYLKLRHPDATVEHVATGEAANARLAQGGLTRLEVDTALQDPAERLRLPDQRD